MDVKPITPADINDDEKYYIDDIQLTGHISIDNTLNNGYKCIIVNFTHSISSTTSISKLGDVVYDFKNVKNMSSLKLSLDPHMFTEDNPIHTTMVTSGFDHIILTPIVPTKPISYKMGFYHSSIRIGIYSPYSHYTFNDKYITYRNGLIMGYSPQYHLQCFERGIHLLRQLRLHYLLYSAWHYYWYDQRDENGHSRACKHVAKQLVEE